MDNKMIQTISNGTCSECIKALEEFTQMHEKSKDFKSIDGKTKEFVWDSIFSRLKTGTDIGLIKVCFNTLRILSREKDCLDKVMTDERVDLLLTLSGLKAEDGTPLEKRNRIIEGLKVIFNMIFQSPMLQIMFVTGGILNHSLKRIQDFVSTPEQYEDEFQYFVCRIMFLITALCQEKTASRVRNVLNGLPLVTSYMESVIERILTCKTFDIIGADILCEIFKLLYNLIADLIPKNKRNESLEGDLDPEDLEILNRITKDVRGVLVHSEWPLGKTSADAGEVEMKKHEIRRHAIDVLAAIPASCFDEFIPTMETGKKTEFWFEEKDMMGVEETLRHLSESLDAVNRKAISSDQLAPPLLALHNMAINNRAIRKYLKIRIFPPLTRKDVENLPEKGTTIRNKLVALLTSPVAHITDLAANLLFVICKEKVRKLVKYTGYGNAAGLLANRGLMLGGKPPAGKYSDSEGDSDTEEYREVEHMINPIEGRIQIEHPDPMEGMTDEQKEFEAMKLVNAIDKMERSSGIRPCRIGPDGRPEPIEHVLQLQEALENPMRGIRKEESDSESD